MSRLPVRWVRGLAAAALGLAGLMVAGPAEAAACSGASGVTVVVSSPNGTSTRCAPGNPSSGLSALASAGFSVTQVQTQPGFVCRINGYPSSDPCVRTPPTSRYWSYWHAKRGGTWAYSSSGAASYDPAPGSVEGWSFGAGAPPRVAPPAASVPPPTTPKPTPKPTPRPTLKPTPKPSTSSSAPGSSSSLSRPAASSSAALSRPATTSTTRPTTTSGGTSPTDDTPTAVGTATDSATPVAAPPTSSDTGGGSPMPVLGGLALVLAVGGGAAYVVRRRGAH